MPFNPKEICQLTVNGALFKDWKSVTVYLCNREAYNYYKFTVSEGRPLQKVFKELQIKPGHVCTVTLGGEYAIGGFVTVRQVSYNATAHGVEITGKTFTFQTVSGAASVQGGEMRDVGFTEMANKILKPFGLTSIPKGGIDETPFDRVNVTGQTAWEVLDSHARARNIILGTNPYAGDSYWAATPNYSERFDTVEEGVNILEGREIISMEFGNGAYLSLAQAAPTVQKWGAEVTSVPFGNISGGLGQMLGVGKGMFMPLVNMLEVPGGQESAAARSDSENSAITGEQIKVEIVVQGWFTSQGQLWRPFMKVHVKSPMLIMDQALICKSVTFTQDDRSGTRTTLELWNEKALSSGAPL